MLNIIAHRGFWFDVSEQNTKVAFIRALEYGFGIETDLRDHDEYIVISHDMPTSSCMTFDYFLSLCESTPDLILALNVKADGLQKALLKVNIRNQHFFFDMSVPDMLEYKKHNFNLYTRYSDIEPTPSLYGDCNGVWLDNFKDEHLDLDALLSFLNAGKSVTLVSPELHNRCEENYWLSVKKILSDYPQHKPKLSLCTDFPLKAKGYFNGY